MPTFVEITFHPARKLAMIDAWKCIYETAEGEVIVWGPTPDKALERAQAELKYELEALIS